MDDIRPFTKKDLPDAVLLEKALFSRPWSESALREHLLSPGGEGFVLREDGVLCAYGLFRNFLGEGELLRIGTDPSRRRKGYATRLLRHYLTVCEEEGIQEVFLEVRSQNLGARGLYEKAGFEKVAQRKRYYQDPADDALIYRKKIGK